MPHVNLKIPEKDVIIGTDDEGRNITMNDVRNGYSCYITDNKPHSPSEGMTTSLVLEFTPHGDCNSVVNIPNSLVVKLVKNTYIKYAQSTYKDAGMEDIMGFYDYVCIQIPRTVPNWSKEHWKENSRDIYKKMIQENVSFIQA